VFFTADRHFAQGDGEVALTAIEGSLRATLRLTFHKKGDSAIPGGGGTLQGPFAETPSSGCRSALTPTSTKR
jgi:acetamidase/formamidase